MNSNAQTQLSNNDLSISKETIIIAIKEVISSNFVSIKE